MYRDRILKTYFPVAGEIPLEASCKREGTVLVVSPHPDDDVLGAGGVMAMAVEQRRAVFSLYVTDGRGSPRKDPGLTDEEMAFRREKEALAALNAIRATGGFFLRRKSPDLAGGGGPETQKDMEGILRLLRPAEVYLPAPFERHRTHQICTALVIAALRSAVDWPAEVFGYSLWGRFWGGKQRIVRDIGSVIRKKVEAVLAHSSQMEYKNYHQGILGMNNSDAVFLESHEVQKASFVEIFFPLTELLARKDLSIRAFVREDFEAFQTQFLNVP